MRYRTTKLSTRCEPREAYDRLAAVWSSTTDEGPFNGFLVADLARPLPLEPRSLDGIKESPGSGVHKITIHLKCRAVYLVEHRPLLWRAWHGRDRL